MFVGATVMGTVSFGLGLVVSPILLLFVAPPQSTVVMVNSLIAILVFIVLVQTRSHFDLRLIAGTALGGLVGVPTVFIDNFVHKELRRAPVQTQ